MREEAISGYRDRRGGDRRGGYAADSADPDAVAVADAFVLEDEVLLQARALAEHAGTQAVSPGTGAALRLLCAALGAKAVAEIGTGTGVSGIYLLRGMRPDGVLTTVDVEPDLQRQAREAFAAAGFAANRARMIPGFALEVLPRLADGQYDLVFCDGDAEQAVAYLGEALRLLRPGGVVCLGGAGDVAEPILRTVLNELRERTELRPALLPVGDGLLCAVRA